MSWIFRNIAEYLGPGGTFTLTRDEGIPVEWRQSLVRNEAIPFDWVLSGIPVARSETLPVEWLQKLARNEQIPVEWRGNVLQFSRSEAVPVEWGGLPFGQLLLVWSVLQKISTPLAFDWLVISGALSQGIQLQWTVVEPLIGLTLRWTVLPPALIIPGAGPGGGPGGLGSQDIQRPTSIQQKTP